MALWPTVTLSRVQPPFQRLNLTPVIFYRTLEKKLYLYIVIGMPENKEFQRHLSCASAFFSGVGRNQSPMPAFITVTESGQQAQPPA